MKAKAGPSDTAKSKEKTRTDPRIEQKITEVQIMACVFVAGISMGVVLKSHQIPTNRCKPVCEAFWSHLCRGR